MRVIKNPPAGAGDVRDVGSIPRLGRSLGGGHGHPLQYSCLENPHGQRSLVDCSPRGRKESDMTAVTEHACMYQHLCSPWPVSTCTRAVDRLQWLSPIFLTGPTPALKLPHRDCNGGQDAAEGSKAYVRLTILHCELLSVLLKTENHSEALSAQSCPALCDPLDCTPPGSCPWNFLGKNTRVGCHFLLQGIFLTQGLNLNLLCLLHCRQIL